VASSGLTNPAVVSLAVGGANLFAGTFGGGVCLSTNTGTSWSAVDSGLTNGNILSFAVNGTNLFCGTLGGGVFLSTNSGASWSAVDSGLTNGDVASFAVSGGNLFCGTLGGGVFLSSNSGANWIAVNTDMTAANVYSLAISGTNIFAGTDGTGVFRRPLSELITSAQSSSSQIPVAFKLQQNYPNPFNPSTIIQYGLPRRSYVTLTVYNALGQQVAILQDGEQEAGYHEVKLDGSNLASGVYFYRLQAGDFVQAKKLLLLR
jgi:hypothetical protein